MRTGVTVVGAALASVVLATMPGNAGAADERGPAASPEQSAERVVGNPQKITRLALDQPARDSKPEIRWWLAQGSHTEETIRESVKEIADSGFAGIEFAMLNEPNVDATKFAYGSQEWINDVKLIIKEATKYGLSASFTSGTHWATANIPGLDPDSEGANHDVGSAHTHVAQGSTLTTVPVPAIRGDREQELVSAVAYKLTTPYRDNPTTAAPLEVDPSSAVDLTEDAQDGTLQFTAEGGDWVVFSFWYRGTAQAATPATQPAYAINYFDPAGFEALKTYWESYLLADPELVEAIRRNGKVQMFMDSLEFSNSQYGAFSNFSLFWTKDMRETFKAMKGYDITPYLPVFLGSPELWTTSTPVNGTVDFSGAAGKTLRKKVVDDLRDVQTHLYMNNLLVPLREWLNEEYDIKLRAQISYGKNIEISLPITAVDYPETETRNQREQTDIYRVHAGGAHLLNKVLSSETAGDSGMNYGYSLQEYLQKNYAQFAGGVNRVIWHGYASKWGPRQSVRWPGYEAGMNAINGRWGSRNPSSKDYQEYNDHLGRVQTVLRAGVPQVDLAILYSDYAYQLAWASGAPSKQLEDLKQQKHEGWQWKDLTLQDNGYTYDYFAPQYLDGGYAPYDAEKGLLAADGPAYQALLIYQEQIPLESARSVLDMARAGLKVVLVQGAMTRTAFNDGKEGELKALKQELLALDNVQLVKDQRAADAALRAMDVEPRVGYSTPDKELLSVTRKDADASYLFLHNHYNVIRGWNSDFTKFDKAATWDPQDAENEIEVEGTVKPYLLDTWTGKITEVAEFDHRDGKTIVPVRIPDGDVRVYIFKDTTDPGLHVTDTDAARALLRNGQVTIRATESGSNYVELSNGKRYTTTSTVPGSRTLRGWDVNVESWNPGELSAPRSETTAEGNYVEEYTYSTRKDDIAFRLGNLTTWNNLDEVGRNTAGVGTYKTTFQWDKSAASGAYLDLGKIVESAKVYVNGKQVEQVNLIDAVVEIPNSQLVEGENSLEVIVTTPMANKMLAMGWNGSSDPRRPDYRLTEGPRVVGLDSQGNVRYRYDQVYTYFDLGLPQAVLTPYVDANLPQEGTPVRSSTVKAKFGARAVQPGDRIKLKVQARAEGTVPAGRVQLRKAGKRVIAGRLDDRGRLILRWNAPRRFGKHTYRVRYLGSKEVAPSSAKVTIKVVREPGA